MHQVSELALERDALNPPLDTAAKRELIESELHSDAGRSDREIARIVGCDHKTVGAARKRLGIAKSFASSISPTVSPPACPSPPDVIDEPEENYFLPESESLVLPSQPAIAVYTNRYEQIVIRQEASGFQDEDPFVYICPQHLDALIVRLRKFLP